MNTKKWRNNKLREHNGSGLLVDSSATSACRRSSKWHQYDSLTKILDQTWNSTRARSLGYTAPIEKAWHQSSQPVLGTSIHKAFAAALQGRTLSGYSHRVQSVIQSVAAEGFFEAVQGNPQIELPLVWSSLDKQVGYTTRLDAHLQLGTIPTLVELTYRPQIVPSLSDLGDKLIQLTGLMAACACSNLGTKQAVVVVVYPFGRPDFFWIRESDLDLLRHCWSTNLKPRLDRYYNDLGRI
jgi:hypothetical protein